MKSKKMPDGYEVRGGSVRVYFNYKGKRCRETIGPNTPANIQRAQRLAQIIRLELDDGSFDYARHFPDSPRVKSTTFGAYLKLLLKIKESELAYSSWRGIESKARCHVAPKWSHRQITEIDHLEIREWISDDLGKLASKTIKEVVSIVRQVFDLYGARNKSSFNPVTGITIRLPDDGDPDPFTQEEIRLILTTPTTRIHELNMMRFCIWDGPRLSEALGLAWEDVINLEKGVIRYTRAQVRGRYKVTKTKRSTRVHRLLKPAREALEEQWKLTGHLDPVEVDVMERDNRTVRKMKIRPVFVNSNTLRPHCSDHSIRARFWKPHLDKAGVRYRAPGHCRHTFISQMLTAGSVPLQWIANHVGHETIEMIQRKYGKWINQDGPNLHAMLEEHFDL